MSKGADNAKTAARAQRVRTPANDINPLSFPGDARRPGSTVAGILLPTFLATTD
jgi:hypothetical protein